MPQLSHPQFQRCRDREGNIRNEWVASLDNEIEVLARGNNEGPYTDCLSIANEVIDSLDVVKAKATTLLDSFMRDKGTWYLGSIDVGITAERQECAFLLDFSFVADNDPDEYGYSYFSVCFIIPRNNLPPHNKPHPYKFIVEFK